MKKLTLTILTIALGAVAIAAQTTPTPSPTPTATPSPTVSPTPVVTRTPNVNPANAAANESEPKRRNFRANKEQITQVQTMLKEKNLYAGEASGKLDKDARTAVKGFQKDNGLKQTGRLNRATLEKMNIELTDAQKTIPVSSDSFAAAETAKPIASGSGDDNSDEAKKRGPVFRANKEQIMAAQKMLKEKAMYAGEETGKLDDATREGLKKFQESSGARVTGTLNKETLEKMNIALTDKQKEM